MKRSSTVLAFVTTNNLVACSLLAIAMLATPAAAQDWQYVRTVGASNGVYVLWDTRSSVSLHVYNSTNDTVEATFTVGVYDKAGGAWPRQTFTAELAPKETKRGYGLYPGGGQRTEGPQAVFMPRILIRNLSQEQRDREAVENRRRRLEEARERSRLEAEQKEAESRRQQERAREQEQARQEARDRALQLARLESARKARLAEQQAEAQRTAQREAERARLQDEADRRDARERARQLAEERARARRERDDAERRQAAETARTRAQQQRNEVTDRVRHIHENNDRLQAQLNEQLEQLKKLIDKRE